MNFASGLERYGPRPALILPGEETISYRQLASACDSFAAQLPKQKQLLLIETKNDYQTILAYLAGLRRGDAVMLIDAELDQKLKQKILGSYQPDFVWRQQGEYQLRPAADHQQDKLHDELALLLSTSGSTGSPKAVRLSLGNLSSNAQSIAEYLQLTDKDRAITSLPLHYSFGMSILNSHLEAGASLVVQQLSILDKQFWQTMREENVTSLSGVPFTFETLAKLRFCNMQLPSLRYLTQAGGRLSPSLVKDFAQLCQQRSWQFYVMYGQTEAAPRISYLKPEKARTKPTSIGSAIPGGRLELYDENDQPITVADHAGELVYSGNNVMLGYAEKRTDLSRGDEFNGLLRTGDIAKFDSEGDFYIVGRKKRFIKLFGQRFGLDGIESQLREQGLIAVCGGRDDLLQIAVEGDHDLSAIQKQIAEKYKLHNKAVQIISLPVLPKMSSGKIDYANLFSEAGND